MTYRTMTELESDIRTRYDIEGFTARHPQAQIFRWINDAIRDFRDRVTVDGSDLFLTVTDCANVATGPTTVGGGAYPGTILSTVSGVFNYSGYVKEVHAKVGSSWVPLHETSFHDALTRSDLSANGTPRYWCLAGVDRESAAAAASDVRQAMRIMVMPPDQEARSYRVVHVIPWADVTTAADKIFTDLGIHEYAICWCGVQLANRDDDVNLWQGRMAMLQACYTDLLRRCKNRTPGRSARVDTRTRGRLWPR